MEKITTVADLKSAIQQLEYKQAIELVLLKEQFYTTYESLKPINIIRNKFKEMILAPDFKTNLVNSAIGLATGFVAKKVFVGKTHNPLTKLLGTIVEIVIANKTIKNADGIKSIGSIILNKIINKGSDSEK